MIERQIEAFAAKGLKDFTVVTGYGAQRMDEALARIAQNLGVAIVTIFNPFYAVADNLASCWMARSAMTDDFIQVNGDNVFRSDLVEKLLTAPAVPVGVATNLKQAYDSDDMKVILDRGASLKSARPCRLIRWMRKPSALCFPRRRFQGLCRDTRARHA